MRSGEKKRKKEKKSKLNKRKQKHQKQETKGKSVLPTPQNPPTPRDERKMEGMRPHPLVNKAGIQKKSLHISEGFKYLMI